MCPIQTILTCFPIFRPCDYTPTNCFLLWENFISDSYSEKLLPRKNSSDSSLTRNGCIVVKKTQPVTLSIHCLFSKHFTENVIHLFNESNRPTQNNGYQERTLQIQTWQDMVVLWWRRLNQSHFYTTLFQSTSPRMLCICSTSPTVVIFSKNKGNIIWPF